MENVLILNIKYKTKIKKFQWRKTYSSSDFASLLLNVFNIKGRIIGLRDKSSRKNIFHLFKLKFKRTYL